jgi:hypothetical protein
MSIARTDIAIEELLAGLGFTGEAARDARRILESEGVTNPRKQRIAASKAHLAREVIDRHWQRVCHNCRSRAVDDGRRTLTVPQNVCSVCGGSNNARAVREMAAACRGSGIIRLVVVGGSPAIRRELADLVGTDLELRLVDGMRSIRKQSAQRDIAWADLVVVLGASQLGHKVSRLYTRDPEARRKLVNTSRRGIEAIADDIARSDLVTGKR